MKSMSVGVRAHRLPVEAAFEEQRAAGPRLRRGKPGRRLEALLQLGFEAVELVGRQVAVAGGVDEGAGRPRRVVEQRLVPASVWVGAQRGEKLRERVGDVVEVAFAPLAGAPEVTLIPKGHAFLAIAQVQADVVTPAIPGNWNDAMREAAYVKS